MFASLDLFSKILSRSKSKSSNFYSGFFGGAGNGLSSFIKSSVVQFRYGRKRVVSVALGEKSTIKKRTYTPRSSIAFSRKSS